MVAPFKDTLPVPVEKVPVPDWVKLPLFCIVTVPSDVKPLVAVTSPEIVGVAVHDVPVTVRLPPRVVSPVPTVRVFVPVIEVGPFNDIAPVPVESVYAPIWEMLLLKVVGSLMVRVPTVVVLPITVVPVIVGFVIDASFRVGSFNIPLSVMLSDDPLILLPMEV